MSCLKVYAHSKPVLLSFFILTRVAEPHRENYEKCPLEIINPRVPSNHFKRKSRVLHTRNSLSSCLFLWVGGEKELKVQTRVHS